MDNFQMLETLFLSISGIRKHLPLMLGSLMLCGLLLRLVLYLCTGEEKVNFLE